MLSEFHAKAKAKEEEEGGRGGRREEGEEEKLGPWSAGVASPMPIWSIAALRSKKAHKNKTRKILVKTRTTSYLLGCNLYQSGP